MLSLNDLLALLPDNTTGEIGADDLRTVVSALWVKTSIAGQVESDGTPVELPPGWSVTYTDPGIYTVTHNMGTLDYAVFVTPMVKTADGMSASVESTTADTFTYGVYSAVHQAPHGCYTQFLVVTR